MTDKIMESKDIIANLKKLSVQDFRNFGLHQISYIRPKEEDGKKIYAICMADGKEVATSKSVALAAVISRQNDLEPVVVH